ncbi:MAG: hypothetical protein OXD44_12435 [Gammaproteobacteria bacterium]|nr:hypothetical protein [Gammaproteobacteria bacterium]
MEIIVATMLLMFTAVLDFQDKALVFSMNIDNASLAFLEKVFPCGSILMSMEVISILISK